MDVLLYPPCQVFRIQGQENLVSCGTTDSEQWPVVSYPAEKALDPASHESPSCGPYSLPGTGDHPLCLSPAYLPYLEAGLQFQHFYLLMWELQKIQSFHQLRHLPTCWPHGSHVCMWRLAEYVYVCVCYKVAHANSHFCCMDMSNSLNIQDKL